MKRVLSVLTALVLLLTVLGTAAAAPMVYELKGPGITVEIPGDYAVFDQRRLISGNAQAAGLDQAYIDDTAQWLSTINCLLYAEQIDGYDNIYCDSDSFMETLAIKDLTEYCKTSGLSDEELLKKLGEGGMLRTADSDIEDYTSESTEIVTINGEKYGHALGYFDNEDGIQYVEEYNTIKNGKWIRFEMYIMGGEPPRAEQTGTILSIIQSLAYERGAAGFASQAIWGMNGAKLTPFLLLGIAVIVVVVVLVIFLCRRAKKKKLEAPQSAPMSNGPAAPWQNGPQPPYTPPVPPQPQTPYTPPATQQYQPQQPNGGQAFQPPHAPQAPQTDIPVINPKFREAPQADRPQPIQQASQPFTPQQSAPIPGQAVPMQPQAPETEQDIFKLLEDLSELRRQGVITEEEFNQKKKELLKRL